MDLGVWRERLFGVCWTQHGGSGLNCELSTALGLSVTERDWLLERILTERKAEAKAIQDAGK